MKKHNLLNKTIILLLSLVIIAALFCACGNDNGSGTESTKKIPESEISITPETKKATPESKAEETKKQETTASTTTATETTAVPETKAPETKAPETQPPATQPPVTQPPVTQPPVTQPPVTQPPVTQPPVTKAPETTKKPVETQAPEEKKPYPATALSVTAFPPPTNNPDEYRKVARDYMYSMFEYKWKPAEDFTITWKVQGDFGVNLQYKKGLTYYGVPYSNTKAPLCEFDMLVSPDGTYKSDTYYYEETVGNHCSSAMVMSYQQLINLPYTGSLKPNTSRIGLLQFPINLKTPTGTWYSKTLFNLNGKDKIMEAYAALDMGDILYKNIEGSGHTRMVDKVVVTKDGDKIDPVLSYVYTIEQTNQFDSTRKDGINTTWWIDHKYSFKTLYTTEFMPVSLCVYHTGAKLETAYIWMNGNNTSSDILKSIKTSIQSNFPLAFTRVTVTNEKGEVIKNIMHYNFSNNYTDNFTKEGSNLALSSLPKGKYTYKVEAGIARGSCTLSTIEFTIQ